MKKPILLIISNDNYFQPSFVDNICQIIKKTNYFVERTIILKSIKKLTLQKYLIKNIFRLYPYEIFKLILLKMNSKFINLFLKKKIKYFSTKKIIKKNKLKYVDGIAVNEKYLYNLIKKKKYSFIINTGDQIFLEKVIKVSKYKIFNIHLSLLPKYAGIWTIFQQLANNEKYTGVTIHKINNKIDSGKLILQKKIKLNKKFSIFENQLNCYTKIPNLLKKCFNKDFKATKIIKTNKIYGYPNNYEWKKFRSNKGKII